MFEADADSRDDISLFTEEPPYRDVEYGPLLPSESRGSLSPKKRMRVESEPSPFMLGVGGKKGTQRPRSTMLTPLNEQPDQHLKDGLEEIKVHIMSILIPRHMDSKP
jgi:hypothetical protein